MHTADRRAIRRAALLAGVTWSGLSVEILLSDVVLPSRTDDDGIALLGGLAGRGPARVTTAGPTTAS